MHVSDKETLIILATGTVSHYGGKQVEAMGSHGEMLLECSIHDARQAGFNKIIFIIKCSMEEAFRTLIESRIPSMLRSAMPARSMISSRADLFSLKGASSRMAQHMQC